MTNPRIDALLARPGLRQFVKFCLVGATSFSIDFGVSFVLHFFAHLPVVAAKTISFALAVTNGFFWNQRWTFRAVGRRRHRDQYAMFVAVNVVGWLLNVSIMTLVIYLETGTLVNQRPSKGMFTAATLVATVVVTFWNFFANRHWTFRHTPQPPTSEVLNV